MPSLSPNRNPELRTEYRVSATVGVGSKVRDGDSVTHSLQRRRIGVGGGDLEWGWVRVRVRIRVKSYLPGRFDSAGCRTFCEP